ncbi:probable serine/threonine-protein kinase DDB_G0282963 isoform X1 [Ruditapes philippinarum]|uniref:probable serine/threonine-protein kinase DDB_G0282963 isoform X1 n=1 Tax=Ruditapes philippinarum TaxID=129788 RepID=UPI00295B13CE|nr:probable serine/threonine-protein kinase DDB_G0282963 isoform X1 [Ruditapes philippinarum]XP_060603670.1 probable serine/threonine-protein kinase DDB_G0282963 isoform X1 [Ruditapes philippinarum]XP_060603671.1 probable serine/threonine-protein kinase DDB_G0282963 isoform X1 [Ruditapes philippinarum]
MAQRRGHHQPPEHEWYLHRLQPGYSPYHPTNDARLYTQNNTEFCRDLNIGDRDHDIFYHEGTVSERYYKDDYRDYSSTGHNQFQPEPVEYTGHDRYQPHSDIRYQPHPNEYAGHKRYQPDPVEYTGQDRYQPHPDEYSRYIRCQPHHNEYTGHDRYQPDPVEYTDHDRYQPDPVEYTGHDRYQPDPVEYTGHDRYQPHPDRYASDIRYQPDPNEYTGQKSYQPDPNEYTGHKQYQPYFDEYTALNHDQFTSYKKHQPNSDEYIDHNRSQFQSVKDTGLNRFERIQSGPLSYASTSNNRQIPSLTGRGSYRSPSKKWNSPKRSSGSANKIVYNTISKPGSKQVTTPPQTSPSLLVEVKRNHESAPAETAMRELPKFDKPGQIDSMKSQTINFENQTSYKEPKVDLPLNSSLQVIDSEDELSKQSDKKSSEIPVPGSPAAKLCQKQILPRKEVDIDNQENSITENLTEDKLIEEIKEENSDTATCNVKELSNESQNFSEVELVNKLKSVDLGTSIKGKDSRQEKLANAQSTAKTADVNVKAKSSAVAGVEKVDKTEKSDNVMDISCSRKDSVTNEQEPEKLEDEMHVKLNFASQEVVHKEIDDKNKEDEKNNSLKQADDNFNEHVNPSNENVDETSKSCGKIEQDNDVEDTSHRNKSVLHSLNVSEPDYSKIRDDLTKYAKESDIKELQTNEDLNGKCIDQGGEVLSDDWKSKKINDFHKRVLGKLSVKTSLVQKINNRSLEILKKEKDLNTSGSSLELCSHEESMEIDESLDLITDTDTSVDLESNIDHEFININDPNVDSRSKNEKYKVHINQPKEGEIEACLDSSSKENSMDMFKTLTNTEQEVVVDRDEEMISEYLGCEGFNQVKGSEIDLVNDMSDVSMHFIDNVELNLKKVYNNGNVFELNTGGTNNTDNAKFENSGNAVVVFDGDLGGLNTNNSLAVVDVVTDYFNNSENANELQNINTLETGDAKHMNNKDIVKIIDGNIIESKDNGSNVGTEIVDISAYDDETFGESENRIVDFDVTMKTGDHDVVYDKGNLAVEVGSDTVANCSGKDVLQDLALKQKFKIRESFIPLDKVDCHGYKGNPSVKQSSKYIETETEDTEGNTEETIGNTEDISINKSCNDQQHNKPMDTQSVETDSLTASEMHSLTDLNKGDTQEKSSESSNGGLKKVIPLSERFGQLTNRPGETDHDSEETEFKAEYENIVNRLKTSDQKSGPHEQTTSNTEQYKEMEVDEPTGENEEKVSEMANEVNDKVIKYNDRKEVAEQSNKENLRQSMSNGDANNDNGMSEVKKDVKPMGTSPVSFLDYSDESDDELLVTPSAFLRSIEEINGRPLVITPTKVIDSSQNSNTTSSSSDLSPLKPVAQRPGLKNKFTLDGLLADHEEKADHVKEMNEIDKELQNEIKQGGFVNILNKEDAEIAGMCH